MGVAIVYTYFLSPTTVLESQHPTHTKMSAAGDISLLDNLSSRVLNDFRDEVLAKYLCNEHKIYFIPPDILKQLHFQQCPDISQS
jgi:hypothetical protein